MRVLIVSHTYISAINRKKWQVLASLYPSVDLAVVFPSTWSGTLFRHDAEKDLSYYNSHNCKFIALRAFKTGNEVLYGFYPAKLFTFIKKFKPDLIHVEQGDNALSYFQCILFAKLLRLKPKFVFFTWVNWTQKFSLKYKLLWSWLERFNLNHSDGAIVGNADAAVVLKNKGFSRQTFVLPQLGVDTEVFVPAQKQDCTQIKIGFVGRLVEEKGIFTLLDAFSGIIGSFCHPELNLIYLGRGPCCNELEQKIKAKNLQNRVFIKETVPHDQVVKFIQDLDILVLPSFDLVGWREQFGHVLIEAMACNVPVVGSSAGEIPNIIATCGLVFEQKNVKYLQQALERLIENKDLRLELGLKGYELVYCKYSHQAIAHKTHDFWIETMKR